MWKRRRRDWWFGDIFGDIDEEFNKMMDRMNRIFDEFMKFAPGEVEPGKPFVYGFSVRIGPDGKPHIQEFGNTPAAVRAHTDERKPIVDVFETDDEVQVIAEMPGVEKEDIELNATETTLEIRAKGETRQYSELVDLPAEVDPDSSKASYKNGVLEVILKKKEPTKTTKKKIDIE
jgi:HSP20 family protein